MQKRKKNKKEEEDDDDDDDKEEESRGGAISKGMEEPLEARKGKDTGSLPETPEGAQTFRTDTLVLAL